MDTRPQLDCAQCNIRSKCVASGISSVSLNGVSKESRVYFRGEKLMDGFQSEGIFLIRTGLLRLFRKFSSGVSVTIDLVSTGDMLGYPMVFQVKDASRIVDVVETSEVCFVSNDLFWHWLKGSEEGRARLIRWAGQEYQRREEQICSLSSRSVRERTAEALIYLTERFGTPHADGVGVPTSLTREDIAALIGTARESVVRQLAEFKDEGCIALDGRQIVVKALDCLRKIARVGIAPPPVPVKV